MNEQINHILIVDDNDNVRQILLPMLDIWMEGHAVSAEVHEALNGEEALNWVKARGTPDLLLLDVRMPVMNGAQFLHSISLMGQDIRKQTLLLTGYADDLEVHLGTDALLMRHLRKPFTASELFSAMDNVASSAFPAKA